MLIHDRCLNMDKKRIQKSIYDKTQSNVRIPLVPIIDMHIASPPPLVNTDGYIQTYTVPSIEDPSNKRHLVGPIQILLQQSEPSIFYVFIQRTSLQKKLAKSETIKTSSCDKQNR